MLARLPIIIALGTSLGTVLLWRGLCFKEQEQIKQLIEQQSSAVKSKITAQLESRVQSLDRMAQRWQVRTQTPKQEWEVDARYFLRDYGGVQAIEWIDSSYNVRWIVPQAGNEADQNLNISFDSQRRIALELARKSGKIAVAQSINSVQADNKFLVYIPLYKKGKFDGFVVSKFRIKSFLDILLKKEEFRQYKITIFDGKEKIYNYNADNKNPQRQWEYQTEIDFYNVKWQVHIEPTTKLLNKIQSLSQQWCKFNLPSKIQELVFPKNR
jgi:sensor domain CHASE-containing protein